MQLAFKAASRKRTAASLAELPAGAEAVIDRLDLPEEFASRLMEMGFIPGHRVTAAMSAPGGDPRVFRVEGAEVALRRETARHILVRNN
ncbi:MAG: FeoA family protein [Bryobacteraceae bacterium]|jgi:Fe2+ transport system protein FeoA